MMTTETKQIACGNKAAHGKAWGFQHHHGSVAEVRQCFATPGGIYSLEEQAQADQDYGDDPDQAYEHHLENAGWAEARAQEDYEAQMGVVPFEDAMAAAYALHRDGTIVLPDEDGMEPLVIGPKAEQPALPVEVKPDFAGLPDGTYTVEIEGGHRTFRVKTQKTDAKFAPGKRILSVLTGKDNEGDYTGIGFVSTNAQGVHSLGLWKKAKVTDETLAAAHTLLEDPRSALTAGRCARCQRLLTTPSSLSQGMGDECAGKMGL